MTVQEYNTIVKLYSDNVYRYILKSTGNPIESKDIMQNVFLKLWQNRNKVEVEYAKGLLFRMAKQNIIDTYRSNTSRRERENIANQNLSTNGNRYDTKQLLDQAFDQLKPEEKTIVLLRDYEGYSYEEIGNILEIPLSSVKVNIFRARKKLQSLLITLENEVS